MWTVVAAVALTFPALTGRIVDQANVISADAKRAIEPKLADLEAKSGIQLVVATVNSLEGQEIEPYANALFREWKLGEKAKNNGVLLLVAPNEHRVRIEVGYGLEGTLTDALGKVIITNAITPRFKTGDFSGGISRGVDDIITVLTTDSSEWEKRPSLRLDNPPARDPVNWLIVLIVIVVIVLLIVSPGFRWFFFNIALNILLSSGSSSGSSGAAVADFPAAEARQAAAERRGAGDESFRQRTANGYPTAIHAAEARTSGEIVCVLAQSSVTATALPVFLAAMGALALPWLLVSFTAMPVYRILSLQVVAFVILMAIFCWPPVRVALMPRSARRAVAHRAAMEQFTVRGLARKKRAHRHIDLCLARRALCTHHRRRGNFRPRSAIALAGGR